jgi:hypothetical protein
MVKRHFPYLARTGFPARSSIGNRPVLDREYQSICAIIIHYENLLMARKSA